jgi:hypothetical protein
MCLGKQNTPGQPDLDAIAVEITRARIAGLPLLCVVLSDGLTVPPVSAATEQIMALVAKHHPTAKLLVRWYVGSADPKWYMTLQV